MPDEPFARETIRDVAGSVARTPHSQLPHDTIDACLDIVAEIEEKLDAADDSAVEDLLTFWDGYIVGGLEAEGEEGEALTQTTTPRDRIKRANEADLFGLDLYQALLKLEEAHSDDDTSSDTVAGWARRVEQLTLGFVDHLEGHRSSHNVQNDQ